MYLISKLFTAWFLPPGLAITVLVLWALALMRKKQAGTGILMLLFAACLYAACISPVSDRLILPLENAFPRLNVKDVTPHDVYVVLGGGIHDNAPDLEGRGSPKGDSLERLVYAFRLYRIQPLSIIVSSGKGFGCQRPEAPVMQRYLVQMGVPEKDVFMDTRSRNTYENALAVKMMCEKIVCKQIILITSAYHMKRAVFAFRHAGLTDVVPAPTDYKTDRTCYGPMNYMPGMGALSNTYRALHEYIGMLYYRVLTRL